LSSKPTASLLSSPPLTKRFEWVCEDSAIVHHEGGYVSYTYQGGDMIWHFSLFSEVGLLIQPEFEKKRSRYKIEPVDLDRRPHCIDKIVEEKDGELLVQ
jgi:hypothetical protein